MCGLGREHTELLLMDTGKAVGEVDLDWGGWGSFELGVLNLRRCVNSQERIQGQHLDIQDASETSSVEMQIGQTLAIKY